jgi:defect-in-organelle-trafficking protein DotA
MLLLSLFIRPICMLIGLLIGLVLVYLGTELLDVGYLDLTLQLIADATSRLSALPGVDPAFTVLIITMILLTLYTFILMAVVSQCMTAVYVLPDKIMRWIGLPPESSGIAAMVEQTKSGAESKMGEGAHAGAGMGGDMRHAGVQPVATQFKGKDIAGGTSRRQ